MIGSLIESCLRGIEGRPGRYLRYAYYKRRLKFCGKGVTIDTGVHFINPSSISLGEGVWIDKNCILIAGALPLAKHRVKEIENTAFKGNRGEIYIGNHSHIGLMTIIQGHGGVWIDQYFTSSAGVKIYSLSNDPKECHTGTLKDPAYILHPVSIGRNVWLGLNVIVLGHHLNADVFVGPNEVIKADIPPGIMYNSTHPTNIDRFSKK